MNFYYILIAMYNISIYTLGGDFMKPQAVNITGLCCVSERIMMGFLKSSLYCL